MSNLIAVATAAMSRIIESEFHDVPNARRDADRAAVRIASLIAQGIEAATAAETVQHGSVHESPVLEEDAPETGSNLSRRKPRGSSHDQQN